MKRLVILAPNWLGDAVMALPAIADVRRASPGASIAVAARGAIAPLFSLVPGIDETIVLRRPATVGRVGGWRSIGAELAGRDFDTALLLPNSMHAALVAARAGIAERWGYRSGWRGRLLTRAVRRPGSCIRPRTTSISWRRSAFPTDPMEPRHRRARRRARSGGAHLEDAPVGTARRRSSRSRRARPTEGRSDGRRRISRSWRHRSPSTASRCVLVGSAGRRADGD